MKNNVFNILAFVPFFFLLSIGCKKDEVTPPKISINSPFENSIFNVYDNISISASVSSASDLSSIKVGIVNDQMVPVMSTIPLNPSPGVFQINYTYNLYDIHLAAGTYYVWVSVGDSKNNQSNAYKKIFINGLPLKRTGIYFISKVSSSLLSLSKIDTPFTILPQMSIIGDYSGSGISSWYQQLYIAGKYNGNFNAISLSNNSIAWSIPFIGSSNPYFTGVSADQKTSYVSFFNGSVKSYDHTGSLQYSTVTTSGYYPMLTSISGNYLLQEQKDFSSSSKKLVVYYANSGISKQETPISTNVIAFCMKDADNAYVFSNTASQGKMEIYTISSNSFWNRALPAGKILSVAQIDSDTYLIGYDNGIVYKYTYSNNSLITWLTPANATQLRYDDVNGEVFVVETKKISNYNFSNAAMKNTVTAPDTVLDLHLLYNK